MVYFSVSTMLSAVYKVKIFESSSEDSLLTAWFLCLATNVRATGLIACKAWYSQQLSQLGFRWLLLWRQHWRMIKSYLVRGGLKRMPMEKVLGLLIESGALYCMFLVSRKSVFVAGSWLLTFYIHRSSLSRLDLLPYLLLSLRLSRMLWFKLW